MASTSPLTPKVSQISFMGTLWGATAVSALFVAFRIFVRIRVFRRLWVDDGLVILAWLLLLISAVLWQTQVDALYTQFQLLSQSVLPTPEIYRKQTMYFRSLAAMIVAFYTCLFAVKLSFLFFFRRLAAKVQGQRTWWWVVLVFNTAAWITLIGSMGWPCMLKPLEYIFTHCDKKPSLAFQHATFIYNCTIDVITDAMIMTIPALLLWKVKMPLRQKLALIGIFSLTVIVMAISIVRVAVVQTSDHRNADQTWLFVWANVEMGVAIIIACIASFRQLFTKQEKTRYVPPAAETNRIRQRLLSSFRSKFSLPSIIPSTFRVSFARKTQLSGSFSLSSKDCIVPLDNVYVSHGVGISPEAKEAGNGHGDQDTYGNSFQVHNPWVRISSVPPGESHLNRGPPGSMTLWNGGSP